MVPKTGNKIQHPNPFLVEKHFREYVLPYGWLKQARKRKRSGGASGSTFLKFSLDNYFDFKDCFSIFQSAAFGTLPFSAQQEKVSDQIKKLQNS